MELVISRKTLHEYTRALEDFFERFPDKKYPEDVHRYDIEDWEKALQAEGRGQTRINGWIWTMRAFYNWLKNHGHVTYNPAVFKKRYTQVRPEKRPLIEIAHLGELAKLPLKPRDKLLILLPLTTGLRPEQLAKVWGLHFDFKKKVLHLGNKDSEEVVPLRDDVLAEAEKLGPGTMWGGRPIFRSLLWIQNRLRMLSKQAGVNGLTATRLANTYDLHILRAALPRDADLELRRQALEGIPRMS